MQVPGRLHGVEAADLRARARSSSAWRGAGGGEPDADARLAQARELVAHRGVVEHAALERGRVDLVEREVLAEQRARLAELAAQRRDREVLDLVLVDVDAPVRGVGVAPLRADGHVAAREAAALEPRAEEGLAAAVGARRVEVAHAALVGRVEHLVGVALHGADVGVADVAGMAEVDVAGPPEGGEAEPERADGQAGGTERSHGTRTVDGAVRVARCGPPASRSPSARAAPSSASPCSPRPRPIARAWVGARRTRRRPCSPARLGGRDIVIGAGLALAAAHDRDPRPWLVGGVAGRHRRRHRHRGRRRRHPAQRADRHERRSRAAPRSSAPGSRAPSIDPHASGVRTPVS